MMDIEVTSTKQKTDRFISKLEAVGGSAGASLKVREAPVPYLKTKTKADSSSRDRATATPAAKAEPVQNFVFRAFGLITRRAEQIVQQIG